MQQINKHLYSKNQFVGYNLRLMIRIDDVDGFEHSVIIYTDNTDSSLAFGDIKTKSTDKVVKIELEHIATREQDEAATAFINKWLNEGNDELEKNGKES